MANDIPEGWQDLDDEAKADLLYRTYALPYQTGLKKRPWRLTARPKQLPPEDKAHHLKDANGYACGCEGGDSEYRIWLFLGGRGTLPGKQ